MDKSETEHGWAEVRRVWASAARNIAGAGLAAAGLRLMDPDGATKFLLTMARARVQLTEETGADAIRAASSRLCSRDAWTAPREYGRPDVGPRGTSVVRSVLSKYYLDGAELDAAVVRWRAHYPKVDLNNAFEVSAAITNWMERNQGGTLHPNPDATYRTTPHGIDDKR